MTIGGRRRSGARQNNGQRNNGNPRPWRSVTWLVGGLFLATVTALSPGSAQARTAPTVTTLSPTGQQISDYHVEADAQGRYGAVWTTIFSGKRGVSFRLRSASGHWSPTVVFGKGKTTWHPRIAATSDGRWVLTWVQPRADGSTGLFAVIRGRNGRWTTPAKIGGTNSSAQEFVNVDVRGGTAGRALLTYAVNDGYTTGALVGRTLTTDGTWTAPTRIALPATASYYFTFALTESGRLWIAIPPGPGGSGPVMLTGRTADGAWDPVTTFDLPAITGLDGVAIVATGPDSVQMHYIRIGLDLQETRSLWFTDLAADGSYTEPALVPFTPAGRWALVGVFPGRDGRGSVLAWRDTAGIHWLPRAADGSWGSDTLLTSQRAVHLDSELLADGRRVVVWSKARIMRRIERPDGSWSAVAALSGRHSAYPLVAASPRGGYTTVWDRSRYPDLLLQAATAG